MTAPALGERVERLVQREAIQQMLVDFVASCDDGYDADRITAFFTDDAVMDLGPLGSYAGHDEIHAFFARISEQIPFTLHFQTGYAIAIAESGEEARGRWYGFEMPTIGERASWGAFTYEDEYRRDSDRWLIARLGQRFHFLTGYDTGWVEEPSIRL